MKSVFVLLPLLFFSCGHKKVVETPTAYQGLGKDSVSPELLKKFSPPAVDGAVNEKVKKILDISTPGMGLLHPDGKRVFFTWRVTGQTQVWRAEGPLKFPTQMTGGKDSTILADITPDGKWLVLTRDIDGQENPGIYLQSPEGGELIQVFKKEKVRASPAFITDDSQWLYFVANDLRPDSNAIYRYNIKERRIEAIFSEPGTWYIADHQPTGDLMLVKLTGSKWQEYYELKSGDKLLQPILGQNEKEDYQLSYSAQANEYIVLTPKFDDFQRLYRFRGGKFLPITPSVSFDISDFKMDRARTKIVYETNEKGYSRLHAVNAKTFKEIKLPEFKDADHVYSGSFSKDGSQMMLGIANPQQPQSSYSYNWQTGSLVQWVAPSVPEIDLKKFVRATLEHYPARDGTLIPMFVRRPISCVNKTCPTIVDFHGGPEGQSRPGFSPWSQLFIDEGFVLVEPNVRGSEGYGKKWLESDNAEKRLNVITDIEDAAKFIRKNWAYNGIVPKIGVMGGSYGGYSTLMAMTRFAGSYDGGVANVGMSNLVTFLNNTAPYRRHLRISEYGDPEKQKDVLLQLSPITYLSQLKDPLMIVQGANDPRVPVGEAVQFFEALQKKGVPAKLIIFPDEGHGAQKKENRAIEIGQTLQFFKEHLTK